MGVTTEERIAAIEARLQAATPGPWELWENSTVDELGMTNCIFAVGAPIGEDKYIYVEKTEDATLIANAPADLRWLLAQVAQLSAACDEQIRYITLLLNQRDAAVGQSMGDRKRAVENAKRLHEAEEEIAHLKSLLPRRTR